MDGCYDDYNVEFDFLTEALQRMAAAGITRQEVLPSLVDFTATVAVALGGEEVMHACIIRFEDLIEDFREGKFPLVEEKR